MIPDGTSLPVVSLTRWYQWYILGGEEKLAMDPYFCGLVKIHSSNAPIGDSAPTTSTYMTGYYSMTGFVSTYPKSDPENDIYPTDSLRQYQPLATLAEAAKIIQNKSIGVVATCFFPHATPADVTAHNFNRNDYVALARVMAHNNLDVVISGGTNYLRDIERRELESTGTQIITDDITAFREADGNKL
ncbi:MAG: alkaline phosphatase [Rikenellaceae bacterium]|nr:alkaline phosphatase [Rikenellaceae bacterium]